jgi:hypothetical protein
LTAGAPDLAAAFDDALRLVERALASDMRTRAGETAGLQLARLRDDLRVERAAALARGGADPEWVRATVRRIVEWTPDTELPLVAALGRIARAGMRPR